MGGRAPRDGETAADGRRLRWTEHRAQRRAAFVAAGAAAVDRHGPGASAEQIADEAGVSRTVLYRYFRDREDLRQAIAELVVKDVLDAVLPKLQLSTETTPRQIIGAAIGTIIGWLDEHPNLYHFLRLRRDGGLESVENTLADNVASLLKIIMVFFGIEGDEADPGAYGIVGFVESAGGWWLQHRSIPREKFTAIVCNGVWHLLEGTAREHGLHVEYDAPLPIGALAASGTGEATP
ncbi:transcriptional regulator, TetR family [Jatrophihabitans endophyticus]|uniref:Transcriptional regulator, TetR family n=1 Tax=Jatrophihabitans endophyticus TaxID=1206085 RepID=A0A1M5GSA2_9ACTN|nr:TetR/AcrR family transcriptional regulator [Jatrophihabitans endophyticus]SHG06644.1 transcriptional regulator, TetR family [Jatrophihabitans endophyticus]